jgi:uncharacterized membrane protein YgdD (TMEM256/DUF423 family)
VTRALVGAAGVLGFIGVAIGAFGAHALRSKLTEARMANLRTATDYQMWHALAIGLAAFVHARWGSGSAAFAGWAFVVGVVLFSGSLYALAVTGERRWGAVTPVGGVALLVGWAALVVAAIRA